MEYIIFQEIKRQLYYLYTHGLFSSEQYKILKKRLYKFYNKNDDFSYVQIMKYVIGDEEYDEN